MRTRQKFTAVGALTLATTAIGGGALVTSHAMAADAAPLKGTTVVVSMTAGADSAIQCTFDDIDLPTALPALAGTGDGVISIMGTGAPVLAGGTGKVITAGPVSGVPASGVPAPGDAVQGSMSVTVEAGTVVSNHEGNGPTLEVAGEVPEGAAPPIMVNVDDARPGTEAECAALRPGAEQP